jgi:hypothetical protein
METKIGRDSRAALGMGEGRGGGGRENVEPLPLRRVGVGKIVEYFLLILTHGRFV